MLLRAGVFKGERMRYTLAQLDEMNGHEFEYAVADLLFHNGWRDVEVTQGSGDYSVDVLARRKNMRYGIQCKRYKGSIGVKAVQEAISGTDFYHRDIAAVITNSTYTKQAVKLAQTSGVRLFGRDFLEELIENYEIEYDSLDPENAAAIIRARRPAEQSGKSKEKELQKQSQKKSAGPKKNGVSQYLCWYCIITSPVGSCAHPLHCANSKFAQCNSRLQTVCPSCRLRNERRWKIMHYSD